MLVGVEHYCKDFLLHGKVRSIGQLKYRVRQVLKDTERHDFAYVFCARYNFDMLPYQYMRYDIWPDKSIAVDYLIDLDTIAPRIIKPWHPHK